MNSVFDAKINSADITQYFITKDMTVIKYCEDI